MLVGCDILPKFGIWSLNTGDLTTVLGSSSRSAMECRVTDLARSKILVKHSTLQYLLSMVKTVQTIHYLSLVKHSTLQYLRLVKTVQTLHWLNKSVQHVELHCTVKSCSSNTPNTTLTLKEKCLSNTVEICCSSFSLSSIERLLPYWWSIWSLWPLVASKTQFLTIWISTNLNSQPFSWLLFWIIFQSGEVQLER